MKKDYYIYPAIIGREDKTQNSFGIMFPDLLGCVSHAESQEDILKMGREALGLHLSSMEEDGDKIPEPTPIDKVDIEPEYGGEFVVLIDIWMPPLRCKDKTAYKRKNVTLPDWLEEYATHKGVNFSEILVKGLEKHLGIKDKKNTP
ncbi:Uncharacterized protein BC88300_04638 [Bacillus cytotoxicus]|uniref:type II toxin-antitoxin system HicB family antitoxin n=1 Tax=Bacillus cytotoxicus TaxID=580165 RepID=UPI000863CCB3|nr:type II toxin-antitoxin system HicB family antitoxin [Bacillus cytotoxicus]SCN42945.1 Uncharacterized protein BC88300_04638 [Bacillus cytotoxicus]